MGNLSLSWTQDIPPERKKEVIDTIRNSTIALGQLRKIIVREIDKLTAMDIQPPEAQDNNYVLRIAHHNGQRQMAKILLDLLKDFK